MCADRKVLIVIWLMKFLENGKFCKDIGTLHYKKPFNLTKKERNFNTNYYSHNANAMQKSVKVVVILK